MPVLPARYPPPLPPPEHPLPTLFHPLQNTRRIAKGISNDMSDSVNRTQELVQSLLAKAEKDNNSIYLMKVRNHWRTLLPSLHLYPNL